MPQNVSSVTLLFAIPWSSHCSRCGAQQATSRPSDEFAYWETAKLYAHGASWLEARGLTQPSHRRSQESAELSHALGLPVSARDSASASRFGVHRVCSGADRIL